MGKTVKKYVPYKIYRCPFCNTVGPQEFCLPKPNTNMEDPGYLTVP